MRALVSLAAAAALALAACGTDPEAPQGIATFTGGMQSEFVQSARIVGGFGTYDGAGALATWTITLSPTDGCNSKDSVLSLEIDVLSSNPTVPVGTIPIRPAEHVDSLPSSLLRYDAQAVTSGAITLTNVASNRMIGSFTATTAAGDISGTFNAPICPAAQPGQ